MSALASLRLLSIALVLMVGLHSPLAAAGIGGADLQEGESRALPGMYYFQKGNEYSKRGSTEAAIDLWKIAAGWAMKDAQYNLGITYFKGAGVPADRPLGLAWLALAAERKDATFSRSLAAAWDESSPAEHALANARWRELRERYADGVALPLAKRRYESEVAQITGSRAGISGHVRVWTPGGDYDGAVYKARLQQQADIAFGRAPRGEVEVGTLRALDKAAPVHVGD